MLKLSLLGVLAKELVLGVTGRAGIRISVKLTGKVNIRINASVTGRPSKSLF